MENVEVRSLPCEDCNHTGRCDSCGGTGLIEGEACGCEGGNCIFCDGLGKTPDFYYKGEHVSFMTDFWRYMMLTGASLMFLGVAIALTSILAPDKIEWDYNPLLVSVPVVVMSAGLLARSIRLRKLKRMVKEAEEEFYRLQGIGRHRDSLKPASAGPDAVRGMDESSRARFK